MTDSPAETVRVETELVREDYLPLWLASLDQMKTDRGVRKFASRHLLANAVVLLAIALAITLMRSADQSIGFGVFTFVLTLLVMAAIAVVLAAVFRVLTRPPALWFKGLRELGRQLVIDRFRRGDVELYEGPQTVTLTPDFVRTEIPGSRSEIDWDQFQKMDLSDSVITLFLPRSAAVIVPRRAFPTPEAEREFIEFVGRSLPPRTPPTAPGPVPRP